MDYGRWLRPREMLESEIQLVKYLKALPAGKDQKQDVDELVGHFLASGYYIWNQWRMARLQGWVASNFEKWKRWYKFSAGELAELESITVNVAVVGAGNPRVSMDFDPDEFGVGIENTEEAFIGASASLASFSSLEDANQVILSMGGVLPAADDRDMAAEVPGGLLVKENELVKAGEQPDVVLDDSLVDEGQIEVASSRKRKMSKGKEVMGSEKEGLVADEGVGGASESSKRTRAEEEVELMADLVDRVGDHPEMVKRMDVKLAKFHEFVMGLSVHADMMSSDLPRAMAQVARVFGESFRMDGASKMNLGIETLSALGVATTNANMVFDMCVNDEKVFREMEQGLRGAVVELEAANVKLASAGELLERHEAKISSLSDQLAEEKRKNYELLQASLRDVEELRCRKLLLRAPMLWTRRVKETLLAKTRQLAVLAEEKMSAQTENERLRRDLEVARKEAAAFMLLRGSAKRNLLRWTG
ncbi:uncharacterized protein [Euphorbia lathyris]|uniref:uncharacterized protein n=1 Tax=Euphorbia lathyris TaxID=212925 RepID=UPI00331314B2